MCWVETLLHQTPQPSLACVTQLYYWTLELRQTLTLFQNLEELLLDLYNCAPSPLFSFSVGMENFRSWFFSQYLEPCRCGILTCGRHLSTHLLQSADSGVLLLQPRSGRCRCNSHCASGRGWRSSGSWWSQCCQWSPRGLPGSAAHPSARWWWWASPLRPPHMGWRPSAQWRILGTQKVEWKVALGRKK